MEFSNKLGAMVAGAALAVTPTPEPAHGNLPAGARNNLAAADVPQAPPSPNFDPLITDEPIRQKGSVVRGNTPINDPEVVSRIEQTIVEILHPRGGVVVDATIKPLLGLELRGDSIQRAEGELAVLNEVAKDMVRGMIFAESINPDRPSTTIAPTYGAKSQPFRDAYWQQYIKGTSAEAQIPSADNLQNEAVLRGHLNSDGRLARTFSLQTYEASTEQRELLAAMLKVNAPLHSVDIDKRLEVESQINPNLKKTIELMKQTAPQGDEALASYVKEVTAELNKMPEGVSKTNALKQVEAKLREMGPVALTTFREELAEVSGAAATKSVEKPIKPAEPAKPQLTELQKEAARVSNPLQVSQAIYILVAQQGADAKTVAEFLGGLPDRLKPGAPDVTGKSEKEARIAIVDKETQIEQIRDGLRRRKVNIDSLMEQASIEDRKVVAPYILGAKASHDAARIEAALQRSSDLSGVVREIRAEVIAEQGRDQRAINQRLSEAVKYYNWVERDAGAAPLQESALHRIAEQQQAHERSSERASKRRRE